jgi:hypothetical protein
MLLGARANGDGKVSVAETKSEVRECGQWAEREKAAWLRENLLLQRRAAA